MTESISERISNALDGLPAGERKAAQTLIAEYPLIGLKTVAEYAARAGVSSPTILRFISRLGFQNYAEFQSNLQTEVVEQLQLMYNLTVADAHTFVVGDGQWLVHSQCPMKIHMDSQGKHIVGHKNYQPGKVSSLTLIPKDC